MTDHMTSTKNSHGFPMAILKDCLLPDKSCGIPDSTPGGGGGGSTPGGIVLVEGGAGTTCTRRALTKLAVSVSLPPLPAGLPDFFSDLSFSFRLLPDALLPV